MLQLLGGRACSSKCGATALALILLLSKEWESRVHLSFAPLRPAARGYRTMYAKFNRWTRTKRSSYVGAILPARHRGLLRFAFLILVRHKPGDVPPRDGKAPVDLVDSCRSKSRSLSRLSSSKRTYVIMENNKHASNSFVTDDSSTP